MKCYIILNQNNYSSLSVESLKSKFLISESKVIKKVLNNLILEEIILASWDNEFLVFYDQDNSDIRFKKTIRTLEKDVKRIAENNILLLEAAMKSEC
jgi:hypothetical protein